jgi:nitrogen fixation protein NifU and related proteins
MSHPEPAFDSLYRDLILEHYKAPHGRRPCAREDTLTEGMNPICGDEVDVALMVDDDRRIECLRVDGRGCAISVSSGSILHDVVEGRSVDEARRQIAAVKATLQGGDVPSDVDLGDFEALEGVKQFPVRVKCALLPWTTLDQALRELEAGGLEAGGDRP